MRPIAFASILGLLATSSALGAPRGECTCLADLNHDAVVNAADLALVLGAWGGGGSEDLNGSGIVDGGDLAIVLGAWGQCLAPANDDCSDPIVLTSLSGANNSYCTAAATTDGPDVPLDECFFGGSSQITNDLWYQFTATTDGTMQVSTCSADYDSKIAVYGPGLLGSLCPGGIFGAVAHACNDDDQFFQCGNSLASNLYAPMVAGTTYTVRVGGYNGATGQGNLDINVFVKGDLCFDAIDAFVTCPGSCTETHIGTTAFATDILSNVSTTCGGNLDSKDIWFRFKANCTNGIPLVADVSTCHPGTDFDTVLTVFSGTCDDLTEVSCNDDSSDAGCQNPAGFNRKSRLIFIPNEGELYYVRLAGFNGAQGNYEITFTAACQPGP